MRIETHQHGLNPRTAEIDTIETALRPGIDLHIENRLVGGLDQHMKKGGNQIHHMRTKEEKKGIRQTVDQYVTDAEKEVISSGNAE